MLTSLNLLIQTLTILSAVVSQLGQCLYFVTFTAQISMIAMAFYIFSLFLHFCTNFSIRQHECFSCTLSDISSLLHLPVLLHWILPDDSMQTFLPSKKQSCSSTMLFPTTA